MDSAIRSLNELRLGTADRNAASEANVQLHLQSKAPDYFSGFIKLQIVAYALVYESQNVVIDFVYHGNLASSFLLIAPLIWYSCPKWTYDIHLIIIHDCDFKTA